MKQKDSALPAVAEKSISNLTVLLDYIFRLARKYNTRAFLVGGPVRDWIMLSKTTSANKDLDVAVENHYDKIAEDLAKRLHARVVSYPQFMTRTLILKQGSHIDIARTRKEMYPKPAMLPKVIPALIKDDLKRRDFTINAMALEITPPNVVRPLPAIIDLFNGRQDIRHKIIRILHPKSFIDDPTRIFRAVRFAVRLNFSIEKETAALMKKAIKDNYLKRLSGERILYEIKMIINEPKSAEMIKLLQSYGIINNLFKVQLPGKYFTEHKKLSSDRLKLTHLFSYLPEPFLSKYPLLKNTAESVKALKRLTKDTTKLRWVKKPSEIYRILKPIPAESLQILSCLGEKPTKAKVTAHLNKYSQVKICTTGKTLQTLKITPGPSYTRIMNEILCLKIDGKIKTKTDEIKYIKKIIKRHN